MLSGSGTQPSLKQSSASIRRHFGELQLLGSQVRAAFVLRRYGYRRPLRLALTCRLCRRLYSNALSTPPLLLNDRIIAGKHRRIRLRFVELRLLGSQVRVAFVLQDPVASFAAESHTPQL